MPLPDARRDGRAAVERLLRFVPASVFLLACNAMGAPVSDTDLPKIAPAVLAAVRDSGRAHVMVALVDPPVTGPASDPDARRAAIARLQAEVLERLDAQDYRERQRFESVPALGGTVFTERGLVLLNAHPNVRRVDLDPAGGGSVH